MMTSRRSVNDELPGISGALPGSGPEITSPRCPCERIAISAAMGDTLKHPLIEKC